VRGGADARLRPGETLSRMFPMPLGDPHPSIAEWLRQRGMRTIAVIDDGYVEVLAPHVGVAPGFEQYHVDAGLRYDGDRVEQQYEHEIRFMDRHLGKLLAAIDERRQPTAIFVTADHGEDFVTGGRHHGWSLSEEVLRIPLIARVPGWSKGHSGFPVSLVDLMPTILRLTKTPLPKGLDGEPLDALMRDSARALTRFVFADTWQYDRAGSLYKSEVAAIDLATKATYEPQASAWALYDIGRDPPRRRVVARGSAAPAVRALADYVESSDGTTRLRD
jgi:arylsulfatase A-like enzyme